MCKTQEQHNIPSSVPTLHWYIMVLLHEAQRSRIGLRKNNNKKNKIHKVIQFQYIFRWKSQFQTLKVKVPWIRTFFVLTLYVVNQTRDESINYSLFIPSTALFSTKQYKKSHIKNIT